MHVCKWKIYTSCSDIAIVRAWLAALGNDWLALLCDFSHVVRVHDVKHRCIYSFVST